VKKFLVVLAVLLLAFALVGCKEDVQKQTVKKNVAGSSSGSVDTEVEVASGGSGDGEDLVNFISKKKSLEFSVEYDYSISGSGSDDTWTFKQYFAKNKYRMDSNMQDSEGRFYYVGDEIISCSKQDREWTCMKLEGAQEMEDPTEQFSDIEDDPDRFDSTYRGTRMIAGTTAHCWGVDYGRSMGEMEICYNVDGIPLYMKASSGGTTMEMEAKSFKKGVSASDFVPPAEPMDMAAMMEQAYGGQMPEGYEMPDY